LAEENAVFGECKWTNTQIGENMLEELMRKSGLFSQFTNIEYILFSKSGFTSALRKRAAKQGRVTLISAGDMF
jgi:hypothetical protein